VIQLDPHSHRTTLLSRRLAPTGTNRGTRSPPGRLRNLRQRARGPAPCAPAGRRSGPGRGAVGEQRGRQAKEPDKFIRHASTAGGTAARRQGSGGMRRPTARAWRSRARNGTAAAVRTRARRSATGGHPAGRRGPRLIRLGPVDLSWPGPNRAWSGRERLGQDDPDRGHPGRPRSAPAAVSLGPSVVVGEIDQSGYFDPASPLPARSARTPAAPGGQDAAGEIRLGAAMLLRPAGSLYRRAHQGHLALLAHAGANLLAWTKPTNHLDCRRSSSWSRRSGSIRRDPATGHARPAAARARAGNAAWSWPMAKLTEE